jgi:prepilin-type N-terminal cleavage/methylation domain-containing protein
MLTISSMKTRNLPSRYHGFTLIEVLIVLAIATLVLLIVFLTVPPMQRNERNTSRKRTVGFILSQLGQYAVDNNLNLPDQPAQMCQFIDDYIKPINPGQGACSPVYNGSKQCVLVTGGNYTLCYHERYGSSHAYMGPLDEISIQLGHDCNSSTTGDPIVSIVASDDETRHYAVWTALENTGRICQDNYQNP